MKSFYIETLLLGVITGLVLAALAFTVTSCARRQQSTICNDTTYIRLCRTPVAVMTAAEYDYYIRTDEDCKAQRKHKAMFEAAGKR